MDKRYFKPIKRLEKQKWKKKKNKGGKQAIGFFDLLSIYVTSTALKKNR
jgi:hypothetical protein